MLQTKIMKISGKDVIRNDTIRKNLRRTKTLMSKNKDRKISIFDHICRMKEERLIKRVAMGKLDGVRKWKTKEKTA